MTTRVLEPEEYIDIIELLLNGFEFIDCNSKKRKFKPNNQIAFALQLQASLGLRIGDLLCLKTINFKNSKMEVIEKKTNKIQYRDINRDVFDSIIDYALYNRLHPTDLIFKIGVRTVQKQLKIVTTHLKLSNISTHSFRKMFATKIYEQNNNNLELLKELLNHTSIATTQRYIRVSQQAINKASAEVNFFK